jgi:hypothetical protein
MHLFRFASKNGQYTNTVNGYNVRLFWEAQSANPSENSKMDAFVAVVTDKNDNEVYRHREPGLNFTAVAARPGPAYPNGLTYDSDAAHRAEQNAKQWASNH